jgi:hypothetical protein
MILGWEGHVAYRIMAGKSRGDLNDDRDIGGRIILKWISENDVGLVWTGLICLKIRAN